MKSLHLFTLILVALAAGCGLRGAAGQAPPLLLQRRATTTAGGGTHAAAKRANSASIRPVSLQWAAQTQPNPGASPLPLSADPPVEEWPVEPVTAPAAAPLASPPVPASPPADPLAAICGLRGAELLSPQQRLLHPVVLKDGRTVLPAGTLFVAEDKGSPNDNDYDTEGLQEGGEQQQQQQQQQPQGPPAPSPTAGATDRAAAQWAAAARAAASAAAGRGAADRQAAEQAAAAAAAVDGTGTAGRRRRRKLSSAAVDADAVVADAAPGSPLPLSQLDGAIPLLCRPPPPPAFPPPPPPPPPPRPPPPPPSLYARRASKFSAMYDIDVDARSLPSIPQSFLGISHEWPYIEDLADIPSFMALMQELSSFGSGPLIVRIGGGSSDHMTTVPPSFTWDSLNRLHNATGAQYIVGLNLEAGDIELTRSQMDAAAKELTPGSILTFELGNEPNYYENKSGKSGASYLGCCFVKDYQRHATALSCPDPRRPDDPRCKRDMFAGPVWGHIYMYPGTLDWFMRSNSKWVGLVTVHWYKAIKEGNETTLTLLDEAPLRKEMNILKSLVERSKTWGKPLRVGEMNTISNSGKDGVSNVMAAALWTLDACLEVAATGAAGVNLHQGSGQNFYTAIVRWYSDDELSPVIVRPPWYGMLMFQMAARAGAQMLPATPAPPETLATTGLTLAGAAAPAAAPPRFVKVWPLWDASEKELRIVLVNKSPGDSGDVTLQIAKPGGYGVATVTRLVAAGERPLDAKGGITLGGIQYGIGGIKQGTPVNETVARSGSAGRLAWKIHLPAGSAALVTIPRLW